MFKGMYEYAECLEDEIDDLQNFHTWSVPRLQEHESKIGKLKKEFHDLRNLVNSRCTGYSNGCGKETGALSSRHFIYNTTKCVGTTCGKETGAPGSGHFIN